MDGSGDAGYELPVIHGRPKVLRAPSVKELQHAAGVGQKVRKMSLCSILSSRTLTHDRAFNF